MKLHCHRPSLIAAFQIVDGVVPSRTPKEILKNVKLELADGVATLIGTDSEVGIRYDIPGVEFDTPGETLLPSKRVISILRELTNDSVDLEITEDAICIRSGHSEFRLSAEDPSEFPPVSAFGEDAYHAVSGSALKNMIRRTVFATDTESTRYALGGVLLNLEADKITLAATDSRRLAVISAVCRQGGASSDANATPVIPAKAMSLIERSITEDDEEVRITIHANDALVKCGHSTVYCRLVEGRFPKYTDVIPRESSVSIDLVVGPFYAAVRQAQIVTNEESRGVDFTFNEGTLSLTSVAADIGQSNIELPIAYDGSELTILFDPRFIADYLRIFEPEQQVRLDLIDGESAAVFRTDDSYTYVIMPLSKDR
jgi:DNA polymerase-3 subunit beta